MHILLVKRFWIAIVCLSTFVLLSSGCKKPEETLAGHLEKVVAIMDDNEDEPADGLDALREYVHENGPEMSRAWGELMVELDEIEDPGDRADRAMEILKVLKSPLRGLRKQADVFQRAVRKDDDASEQLEDLLEGWQRLGGKLKDDVEDLKEEIESAEETS